jgi:hypothetical protein
VNAAAVERLHASFGRARVVVLDKAVVEALQVGGLAWGEKVVGLCRARLKVAG